MIIQTHSKFLLLITKIEEELKKLNEEEKELIIHMLSQIK